MKIEIVSDGYRHILIDAEKERSFDPVFLGDEDPIKFIGWLDSGIETYQQHHLCYLVDQWRKGKTYHEAEQ